MLDLNEVLKRHEYKWLEQYKDRLCFICFGGSHAYGTNVETSDIDIRGVMLPTKEELIGLNKFEQKVDEETDTTIYEFNKFIKLISNCNPNTIELLGCKDYLIFNDVGKELIDNVDMFLSKKCINTFGGYATAQLRRLENALCHDNYSEKDKVKHIEQTMNVAMSKLEEENKIYFDKGIKTKIVDDKLYLDINIKKAPIEQVRATLNNLLTIEKTFNKLNHRNSKKTEQKLDKHIMHLVRLYLTCFDILENNCVHTYRKNDREFLLEIRNGLFLKDNKLTDEFLVYLKELEDRLDKDKLETKLPEKPNFKAINAFVMDVNKKVIDDTVFKYDEPLTYRLIY